MAKISRKAALIFGSAAGLNQIAEFGSLAAGAPVFSIDPDVIQSLSNYLAGWFNAVIGANSPAIEDMNALCYLYAYQIAYIMQAGIPEWNATTVYYTGSMVNSAGGLYISQTDNNTGNAVTDTTNWLSRPGVTAYKLNGTFTAPSGVTSVDIEVTINPPHRRRLSTDGTNFILDPSGNAFLWGTSANGQIGDGTVVAKSSPILVLGGLNFQKISTSAQSTAFSAGLTQNGQIYMWGINTDGNLGTNDVTPRSSPVLVTGSTLFSDVIVGTSNTYALTSDGSLYAWGLNTSGQLGDGTVVAKSNPTLILAGSSAIGGQGFQRVRSNRSKSTLALTPAGVLYAWGDNTKGQLGVGDVTNRSAPTAVSGGLTFSAFAIGHGTGNFTDMSYGITTAGTAYAWGSNANGELGVGDVVARSSPVLILGGITFTRIVTSGVGGTTFGLTSAGVAYAWGKNTNGQLGVGDVAARSSPVLVLGGHVFSELAVGYNAAGSTVSVVGLGTDGTLYGWGDNTDGQLGLGDVVPRSSPVLISASTFSSVIAGKGTNTFLASTPNGTMFSWGNNLNGNLGVGNGTTAAFSVPTLVLSSNLNDVLPRVIRTQMTVTPGTAYTVTVGQFFASFGGVVVGKGWIDNLKVIYG